MSDLAGAEAALAELRTICLALPEAFEQAAWGTATFRVRKRMFAHFNDDHHGDGMLAVWIPAAPGGQELLVDANPRRFFVPPYVGHRGWLGVRLEADRVDWDETTELLEDAYRLVAPKRLLASLEVG